MTRALRSRRPALALVLVTLLIVIALPGAAFAQDTLPDEPTPTVTDGDQATSEDNDEEYVLAGIILLFGLAAIAATLVYLNKWRETLERLTNLVVARTGRAPEYDYNPAEPGQFATRGTDATFEFRIRGPATVHIGQGAAFTTLRDGEPVEATWAVEPEGATVEPATGPTTTVTAIEPGPLTITATVGGVEAQAHPVAIPAPADRGGALPVLGGGYAGITIAVVVVTLATAMTAIGRLDGAALAALFGTVVGYFFAEARSNAGGGGAPPAAGDDEGSQPGGGSAA